MQRFRFRHLLLAAAIARVVAIDCAASQSPLEGQVVGVSGRPLSDAVVRIEDETGAPLEMTFSRPSGRFRFDRVPQASAGSVYLTVEADQFVTARERLDLRHLAGLHVIYMEPLSQSIGGETGGDSGPLPVDVRQLLAIIPEEAEHEYLRAIEEVGQSHHEEAIHHLERAVELAPDYYDAWIKLGVQHMATEQFEQAEADFLSAARSNPSGALAPLNLGILRYQQGEIAAGDEDASRVRFAEARDYLGEAVRLDPVSAPARFYLGATLYRLGAYPGAQASLQDALGFDASLGQARLMLLNMFLQENRLAAALNQAVSFIEREPDSPQRPAIEQIRSQLEEALGR